MPADGSRGWRGVAVGWLVQGWIELTRSPTATRARHRLVVVLARARRRSGRRRGRFGRTAAR